MVSIKHKISNPDEDPPEEPAPPDMPPPPDITIPLPPRMPSTKQQTRTIRLPDGRTVTLGPPMIPTDALAPLFLSAEQNTTELGAGVLLNLYSCVLYVRAIDGEIYPNITEKIQMTQLLSKLGELGTSHVRIAVQKFWPPVRLEDIEEIKK